MSSSPQTRSGSYDGDSPPESSPASSPPPASENEQDEKEDADYDPKADAMRKEEERLGKESQRRRNQNTHGNNSVHDAAANDESFKKLEWFMKQSKVASS